MVLPHDGLFADRAEVFVGTRKMAAAEKSPVDRKRRGVYGFENQVALRIGDGAFLLGIAAPEHVDDTLFAFGDGADYGVGEGLPAVSGVRCRFMGADREHGVEQQHALLGPAAQIAALNGYIGQANAGAGYFAANHAGEALVSARLEGSADVAVGVNAGIMWDINSEWSLGMSWRSRMNMKVGSGRAALSYVSPETQQYLTLLNALSTMAGGSEVIPGLDRGTFSAELPLPTTVTWGVSFRPAPKWEFAVDLQWVGWSAYEALNVEFNEKELGIDPIYSVKNYSNTLTFRFGGQYRACDWLTARMGMYVDESPVSSDYLNPETPSMTKVSYTAGLSFRPRKYVSIDVAYCYVSSADPERTGSYPIYSYQDNTKLESIFSGNYKLHAHVLSFGVGFNF